MSVTHSVVITFFTLVTLSLQSQESLPDANIQTLERKTMSFKDAVAGDQVTIVSFWATWCAPCKKELDAIAEVYEDWQEQYNVRLIAISVDDARASAKVKPMVAEKGWPYQVFIDTKQELMRSLHFQTVPYTIVIDQTGKIVYNHSGYLPGDEIELEEELALLVK
ncbi:MAG: TlpA family protein disulfide reductase [Saprospiraceae bacterium]|nr:TlpA family protein disulfide reductase [Saprospiraceae bacterium]